MYGLSRNALDTYRYISYISSAELPVDGTERPSHRLNWDVAHSFDIMQRFL